MTTTHWLELLFLATGAALMVALLRRRPNPATQRFFQHPLTTFSLGWLIFLTAAALLAPALAPYRPSRQLDIIGMVNQAPSWQHPLGTDLFSRDVLSRILFGARVSLGVGTLAMLVAVTAGGLIGVIAGYFRRGIDTALMRLVDVGLAVPRIFIVLVAIALWDRLALGALIVVLGITGWFGTSRLIRAEVLVLRGQPFVAAARAMGAGPWRVVFRHVLPNVAAPLIISAALGIGNVMLLEAALSFLGVGVQPPTPSWGNMIADGRDQLASAPWTTLFPGLAIALVVMALNSVADGLRDALDPRTFMATRAPSSR
jgi:peptide/nickel transport system permease protein